MEVTYRAKPGEQCTREDLEAKGNEVLFSSEMHNEYWNSDTSFLWKIAIVTRYGIYMVEQSSEAKKWQLSSLEWIQDNN